MKIIFIGVQGSGKSTQAKDLAEKLSVPYVEMGQVLRDMRGEGTEDAKAIEEALDKGELVPNEITIRSLNKKLAQPEFKNGFVIDGYPRNFEQVQNLPEELDKVFYVKVSDKEAVSRNLKRGRHDDTEELLARRIGIFHQETEPILETFRKRGILEEVDGERTIEEIARDIEKRIKNVATNKN